MNNKITLLACALSVIVFCTSASAGPQQMNKEGHACILTPSQPAQESLGVSCELYILGFLEGALITDTAIIESMKEDTSAFMERVYKTRSHRFRGTPPPTYLAKFCLPEPLNKKNVVQTILDAVKKQKDASQSMDQRVYNAFKNAYPCD